MSESRVDWSADVRVEIIGREDATRARREQALVEHGVSLPLPHRTAWHRAGIGADSMLLIIRDGTERPTAALAIHCHPSRALPGHAIWRVERLMWRVSDNVRDAAFDAVVDLARSDARVLRLVIELFDRDVAARERNARALAARGFQRAQVPRTYAETIAIDLDRSVESLFASIHPTARRHVRAIGKHGLEIRTIDDPRSAPRLAALLAETMARTGGSPSAIDWRAVIRLSNTEPALSRLVGLFHREDSSDAALLAFAWGCNQGEYVHYDAAASTRNTSIRAPLAYALAWDLICWGHRSGACWFDFGGITRGHFGADDPLGGISDFKRYFGQSVVAVAEDWVLEPSRIRGAVARALGAGASLFSTVARVGYRDKVDADASR